MKEIISIIAGLFFVIGYIPYIIAILRKKTKPAKASWIIWGTLDTIVIAGMIASDSLNGQMIGAVIGVWVVIILSLKYGAPGWTKLDKLCLIGAAIGIFLWQIFDNPILGILISLGITSIGSIPTFISAWRNPERENKLGWTFFWTSCIFALFAIPKWTLANAAQPIIFFIIESIMMYILYRNIFHIKAKN
ncbi:MAG: hypothetical protein RBT30_00430 [Patescibacteria group bacterium]|jgi:hypothetical protein|nr:hypothetical protein [Patescibacteria group bacterium]